MARPARSRPSPVPPPPLDPHGEPDDATLVYTLGVTHVPSPVPQFAAAHTAALVYKLTDALRPHPLDPG